MIGFLFKGLIRDRSRSLFPILMVSAGVFLTVFLYSWLVGVIGDMVSTNARFDTGHVKIITREYNKHMNERANDLALLGVEKLMTELRSENSNMLWTPRIRFGGLLDVPDEKGETRIQGPVIGLGLDLLSADSPETKIMDLQKALVTGSLPSQKNDILISDAFAKKLGVGVGDPVTLISSTMYGAMAMHNFKVAGTLNFGISGMDREAIIVDLKDAQDALDMNDAASEILGFTRNMVYSDNEMEDLADSFNARLSGNRDKFAPIMVTLAEQNNLSDILDRSNKIGSIIILVFIFIMSIVLWNSGLMNGIRRYGEIGLRLAMGEPKGLLYRRMVIESFMIGIVGSLIGTLLGLAVSYYLQFKGIDISQMMQKSTVLISSVIRARVTTLSYFIGFLPGIAAPVLGAMAAGIAIYKRQTAQLFKELEI